MTGSRRTCEQVVAASEKQTGKLFLVTGAYSGIGVETTRAILDAGGNVFIGCRNAKMQDEFIENMLTEANVADKSRLTGYPLDLGDQVSIRNFAAEFLKTHNTLDVLVNNAGIMNTPPQATAQGLEAQMGVNVVGPYLLTKLLMPALKQSPGGGRVIFLASIGHKKFGAARFQKEYYEKPYDLAAPYDGWERYQQSKLGDILLAKEFAKRHDIDAVSVHPGVISTKLGRHSSVWNLMLTTLRNPIFLFQMKSPTQGAATSVTVALAKTVQRGAYYADCAVTEPHSNASFPEDWAALYDWCEKVTQE